MMKTKIFDTLQPYEKIFHAMKSFTETRDQTTPDEIWFLEHEPVFTQGQAGKAEHLLNAHGIPVVQTDRGGQITYHGPGQLMMYTLFDLKRLELNTRELVILLENSVIDVLKTFDIDAYADREKPGVYVNNEKIASLGLRVKNDRSYHGLCLNVNNDLTPFSYINPCGIKNQKVTSLKTLGIHLSFQKVIESFGRLYRA
jgi:lipoyl(octanoyl) transferase